MEKLTFVNSNNEDIVISDSYPYILNSFGGFGGVGVDIHNQKAFNQDGEGYFGNTLEPRYPVIQFTIVASNSEDMAIKRNKLSSALNPKLGLGTLIYEYGGIARTIKALPEKSPEYGMQEEFRDVQQKVILQLYCPSPYFESREINSEEIVTWIGGLEFPVQLPATFATEGESVINLYNSGDWETPFTIEIMGPSTKPTIINHSTGDFIKVNAKVEEGETLVITTAVGNKRAELNGQFASNLIHYTSKYFSLQKGDNVIEVESEDLQDNAKIKISYYNRYLGV